MSDILSLTAAAEATGMTRKALKRRVERGTLESQKIDGLRYVSVAQLQSLGLMNGVVVEKVEGLEGTVDQEPIPTWGSGMAKLVDPAGGDSEIVVFLSDIHVPYHDVQLVNSAIDMIRDVQPDRVVINGDVADFFQLSHFNKAGKRFDDLQWEIDMANEIRKSIREAVPNARIEENEGNHDNRIISYVENRSPGISSLRGVKPENLFLYGELEIDWHPGCGFLLRPEFLVKHGTIVREETGASAKAELQKSGISGISGHVHRLGTYRKAGYVQRQWTEQGGLMRLDPDYVPGGVPNWQQGICIAEMSNHSAAFVVHEIPVYEGQLAAGFLGIKSATSNSKLAAI